jgi:predicted nuclease with RNAse H fold
VSKEVTVVGIDVGGSRKGFHAVALRSRAVVGTLRSSDTEELYRWCVDTHRAAVVAIDAPCAWSTTGRARIAERALISQGIFCYSTPTRDVALRHGRDTFRWILNGESLYASIRKSYDLFRPEALNSGRPLCVETFPHAVGCALAGTVVSAKQKLVKRRSLLEGFGLRERLSNIDWVDAAVCAVAAQSVSERWISWVGAPADGYIVVPRTSLAGFDSGLPR